METKKVKFLIINLLSCGKKANNPFLVRILNMAEQISSYVKENIVILKMCFYCDITNCFQLLKNQHQKFQLKLKYKSFQYVFNTPVNTVIVNCCFLSFQNFKFQN